MRPTDQPGTNKVGSPNKTLGVTPIPLTSDNTCESSLMQLDFVFDSWSEIWKMTPILRSKQAVSDICLFINLISAVWNIQLVSCWKGVGGWGGTSTTQLVKLAVIWTNTPHYIHLDGGGVDTLGEGDWRHNDKIPKAQCGNSMNKN